MLLLVSFSTDEPTCAHRVQKVEVTIFTLRNGVLRVEDSEDNLYASIDIVCDKVRLASMRYCPCWLHHSLHRFTKPSHLKKFPSIILLHGQIKPTQKRVSLTH